jgi:hypothetical protein
MAALKRGRNGHPVGLLGPWEVEPMSQRSIATVVFRGLLIAGLAVIATCGAPPTVQADPIHPSVTANILTVGASGVEYDSLTKVLSITDDTGVFSYKSTSNGPAAAIFNLSGAFGGSYSLDALFTGTATNAPLDGMFGTTGMQPSDLLIQGEIPSMNITPANGYTGTLLKANITKGEFTAPGTSNTTAEFDLFLTATGGDLVTAGIYHPNQTLGELSSILTLSPALASGFNFSSNFSGQLQSGSIGTATPEPCTLTLAGTGLLFGIGYFLRRRTK